MLLNVKQASKQPTNQPTSKIPLDNTEKIKARVLGDLYTGTGEAARLKVEKTREMVANSVLEVRVGLQ